MRRFSSAMRFAFKRLLEGKEESEVLKKLSLLFDLNSRYAYGALVKAKMTIASLKELGQSPANVVFGGRKLFEELSKKHLSGKRRDKLLEKWRERRQGLLFAVGQKHAKGNQNLRLVWIDGCLFLRINVGEKKWVYAKVIRKVKRNRDKWKVLLARLMRAEATGDWFPYTVTLRRKEGKLYAFISFEEELPPVSITKAQGVVGLDLNAVPQHVAWAESFFGREFGLSRGLAHPWPFREAQESAGLHPLAYGLGDCSPGQGEGEGHCFGAPQAHA
jgi:predicted transposase